MLKLLKLIEAQYVNSNFNFTVQAVKVKGAIAEVDIFLQKISAGLTENIR